MKIIYNYIQNLNGAVNILQAVVYTISFLLISISTVKTIILYVSDYLNPNVNDLATFNNARISLSESVVLSLSFITGVEILKLFDVKTYKQLIIVVCLVIIKLLVGFFLTKEIIEAHSEKNF